MTLEIGIDPSEAWARAKQQGQSLKQRTLVATGRLAANSVTLEYVLTDLYGATKSINDNLKTYALTAGLNDYVQSVRGDTYDAVAAINAVTAACDAALLWIDTNAAGLNLTGASAADAIASGSVVSNRFTPAQTAGLRTLLDAVVNAIS